MEDIKKFEQFLKENFKKNIIKQNNPMGKPAEVLGINDAERSINKTKLINDEENLDLEDVPVENSYDDSLEKVMFCISALDQFGIEFEDLDGIYDIIVQELNNIGLDIDAVKY